MPDLTFPNAALTVLEAPGGFELMLKDAQADTFTRVAFVPTAGAASAATASAYAHCLASAFLMTHALDDMLEFVQPDGWGDHLDVEQANTWRAAFRALLTAQGQSAAAARLRDTPIPPP